MMKKIKYNIASQKRINRLVLILFLAGLFLTSLLSIILGMDRLFDETRQEGVERQELNLLKDKLTDVSRMTDEYRERIEKIKKKWDSRVRLSNRLIARKSFPMTDLFNMLEERIPDGVSLNSVIVKNDAKSGIQLDFVSDSFQNLMELYRQLARFHLSIVKESVTPKGMARSTVLIKIKNEKN
jgi:hypothetical protein